MPEPNVTINQVIIYLQFVNNNKYIYYFILCTVAEELRRNGNLSIHTSIKLSYRILKINH